MTGKLTRAQLETGRCCEWHTYSTTLKGVLYESTPAVIVGPMFLTSLWVKISQDSGGIVYPSSAAIAILDTPYSQDEIRAESDLETIVRYNAPSANPTGSLTKVITSDPKPQGGTWGWDPPAEEYVELESGVIVRGMPIKNNLAIILIDDTSAVGAYPTTEFNTDTMFQIHARYLDPDFYAEQIGRVRR